MALATIFELSARQTTTVIGNEAARRAWKALTKKTVRDSCRGVETDDVMTESPRSNEAQVPKKPPRARKASATICDVRANSPTVLAGQTSSGAQPEAIVMKLRANPEVSVEADDQLKAYNADHDHSHSWSEFASVDPSEAVMPTTSAAVAQAAEATVDRTRIVSLLKDFDEKTKNNEWPTSTHLCCYWDGHRFDGVPIGIPLKYTDGRFTVFGCFCSFECAAAYNFASHESIDEMWERFSLINLLFHKVHRLPAEVRHVAVKCAPNRLALKQFGGHMTIDEFRSFGSSGKFLSVNFPPMMTAVQQIEETNESDVSIEQKYVAVDGDRVQKYKDKVLKTRGKPTNGAARRNTLDNTMNIRTAAAS